MKRELMAGVTTALLSGLLACGASPPGSEAQDDSDVTEKKCTEAFGAVATLKEGIPLDDTYERRRAMADFLWALGLDGKTPTSFVYLDPDAMDRAKAAAAAFKARLTGKHKRLVPLVDTLVADAAAHNLHGAPDLPSKFRCLSGAGQTKVLFASDLAFEEREIALSSATLRSHRDQFLRDGNDASNGWGDTVLEGPYSLEDGYVLDLRSANEIVLDGKRITFRVTVGARAVMTDSCEQAEDESWPETCERGSIEQSLYYDDDFERITQREESAEYVAD